MSTYPQSLLNYTLQELVDAGVYVFIAEPKNNFNPDVFNPSDFTDDGGVDYAMTICFTEAIQTIGAEPLEPCPQCGELDCDFDCDGRYDDAN